MNPEELLSDAEKYLEESNTAILSELPEDRNRVASCIFLARQRILDALGELYDRPDWIVELEEECSETDLYHLSCMIHGLVERGDFSALCSAYMRYKTIFEFVKAFHNGRKLPDMRSFGADCPVEIPGYQGVPTLQLRSELCDFHLDILEAKKVFVDFIPTKAGSTQSLFKMIAIRESLHVILTSIWTKQDSQDDEADDVFRLCNASLYNSLHDIPTFIEDLEDPPEEGYQSILSFITFLEEIVGSFIDYFSSGDVAAFTGRSYSGLTSSIAIEEEWDLEE